MVIGEASFFQIGHDQVYLECDDERKGYMHTQQIYEQKGFFASILSNCLRISILTINLDVQRIG